MDRPRWRSSHESGFTLVETLIYCVLLSLFATIFFLAMPTRSNLSTENLSLSVERASVALSELNRGISNSAKGKILIQNGGASLIFLSATDRKQPRFSYNSTGQVLWRRWDYYILEKGQIFHAQSPLKTAVPTSETGDPPRAVLNELQLEGVLAKGVETFKVNASGDGFLIQVGLNIKGSSVAIDTFSRPRNP